MNRKNKEGLLEIFFGIVIPDGEFDDVIKIRS